MDGRYIHWHTRGTGSGIGEKPYAKGCVCSSDHSQRGAHCTSWRYSLVVYSRDVDDTADMWWSGGGEPMDKNDDWK